MAHATETADAPKTKTGTRGGLSPKGMLTLLVRCREAIPLGRSQRAKRLIKPDQLFEA